MLRYANPHDFETRVTEGDQVLDGMDIVLDVVVEFDGQNIELHASGQVDLHVSVMLATVFV